ncbi:MAG: hypothetical protein KA765_08630 [Thermoflexales bacterium]|nr:hypothetical protein [Thermoflexales bacterium]
MPDELVGRDKIEGKLTGFDPVAQKMKERAEEAAREAALEQAAADAAIEAIRSGRGGSISIGNSSVQISGGSVGGHVAGRDNIVTTNTTTGMSADEFSKAFSSIYDKIKQQPPEVQKDVQKAVDTLKKAAQSEVTQGKEPDESDVTAAAKSLAFDAPDILKDVADVALATMSSPATGVLTIVRKVLQRIQAQRGTA